MAKGISSLGNNLGYADLKRRALFLVLALLVYRIGTHVPVPGVDPYALEELFNRNQGGIISLFNMFSGGALSRFSVFALGIMPYISASIFVQLLSVIVPSLSALKKEGEAGRRKISRYTRYITVLIALVQAIGVTLVLDSQQGLIIDSSFFYQFTRVLTLVAGTMFVMWLGEQITERGLGNGISMIIFAGIVSELPSAMFALLEMVRVYSITLFAAFFIITVVVVVTFLVVFVEMGQRKIVVNYAQRQVGNKIYRGQNSHLPLKLNMSGVIPPIFASALMLLPATVASWFSEVEYMGWLSKLAEYLSPRQPIYLVLYSVLIVFFCFFYTALVFNSRETADNLKKSGALIPGIRPGEQTSRYIDKILTRLTLVGALYILLICLVPEFLVSKWSVPFSFGGTSLLIIVVVTMDFMTQVQTCLMSYQYDSLLKKANFKS
ncbi:preprotein translocase subunit SecY [Candidatus Kinetoplastidibacterium crithidiae]|uniref:Protein translocase subunit SecY n=1 Tax=Candidatus Kinetoplastidibacterium crithidiae TCC036E TaxID=1208918 RepID=M1M7E0_9PROT|nr:preprotein translocase subunit SecY [Candidatus Kinetoplastibacterium crithidii]AFZ82990.1 preprotein translocase subunit SecY [Candidatus Kinetoplastibacterium crithidii (ex Angomonas deanei ATCC 30255)]AGF47990.1 preprotein translocase subunit SecY [Candidatus Kinetoplastibacterium crithidii TCC036E]